jgi:hypothetical protein
MAAIDTNGFLPSQNVIVYPCAYRANDVDLKSKVNLEENIVRSALYGSTGSNTYIISKTDSKIICFIKGYYFELTLANDDLSSYSGISANLAEISDAYNTKVLAPYSGNAGDIVDIDSYFKALKFVKSTDTTSSVDLYLDETKQIKPVSYTNVGSVINTTPIAGNVINGTGEGSVLIANANNAAGGKNSVALGTGNTVQKEGALVAGKYADTKDNTLFAIGKGESSDKRSNVISATNDGVTIAGALTANTGDVTFKKMSLTDEYLKITCDTSVESSAPIHITNSTEATSSGGALKVSGGAYIEKGLYLQGGVIAAGQIKGSSFYATSDERRKDNIEDYRCENSILDLQVRQFELKADGTHHIGCIAQDLQKICPEIVKEDEDGYLAIEESKIVYLLLDEVKALKKELEKLKERIK